MVGPFVGLNSGETGIRTTIVPLLYSPLFKDHLDYKTT